jgi:membrane-bound ClpP family serine protease
MLEFVAPFLLLLLALALLVAEDLLPTGGALGLLAAGCLGLLLYLGFSVSTATGFGYLALEMVLVPAGFAAWSQVLARTKLGRVAYLRPPEAHEVDASLEGPDLVRLVGLHGRALTTLRPSGMVDFDGRRLDGVDEEGLIPPGSSITAVGVSSGRLVVRPSAESRPDGAG